MQKKLINYLIANTNKGLNLYDVLENFASENKYLTETNEMLFLYEAKKKLNSFDLFFQSLVEYATM